MLPRGCCLPMRRPGRCSALGAGLGIPDAKCNNWGARAHQGKIGFSLPRRRLPLHFEMRRRLRGKEKSSRLKALGCCASRSKLRLVLKGGYLHSTDSSDVIQGLIASCTPKAHAPNGPGGEISIYRGSHNSLLRVTVTPLRSKRTVAELPWLGLSIPVAIITVSSGEK